MINKIKLFKDFRGGFIIAGLIVGALYVIYVINFYPIRLLCEVRISSVRFQASQFQYEADQKARDIMFKTELAARRELLQEKNKWLSALTEASKKSFSDFFKTYLEYKTYYGQVRDKCDKDRARARKEAAKIRQEARDVSRKMVGEVKDDFNIISLVFKGRSSRKVKGYLYDPDKGELVPRTDLLKLKEKDR